MLGLLLNWRPRRFLDAVARAVPSATGVLIQFPLYGGIASILTAAKGSDGLSLAQQLANCFTQIATSGSFPVVMGAYSAVLGFFVPSGGGKWLIEAPYLMQSANQLHAHLGWAVQVYWPLDTLPQFAVHSGRTEIGAWSGEKRPSPHARDSERATVEWERA